jgi:hypothetical protein
MAESGLIPTDPIDLTLVHLEAERSYYEAARSDKQLDRSSVTLLWCANGCRASI